METLIYVLFGMCFILAVCCVVLLRDVSGIRRTVKDARSRLETLETAFDSLEDRQSGAEDRLQAVCLSINDLMKRVSHLEKGMVPDFEAAKAAVKSVNDFNSGLSAILNFDPMAAAKQQRSERTTAGGGTDGV